jgi:hypothetical protein
MLVDIGVHHFQAWFQVIAQQWINLSSEQFSSTSGMNNDETLRVWIGSGVNEDLLLEPGKRWTCSLVFWVRSCFLG